MVDGAWIAGLAGLLIIVGCWCIAFWLTAGNERAARMLIEGELAELREEQDWTDPDGGYSEMEDEEVTAEMFDAQEPLTQFRIVSEGDAHSTQILDAEGKSIDLMVKSVKWECDASNGGPALITLECYGVPIDAVGFNKPEGGEGESDATAREEAPEVPHRQ